MLAWILQALSLTPVAPQSTSTHHPHTDHRHHLHQHQTFRTNSSIITPYHHPYLEIPLCFLLEAWTWGRFTSFQHASALGHGNLLAGMLAQLCFAPFAKVSAAIRRSKEPRWDPDPSL